MGCGFSRAPAMIFPASFPELVQDMAWKGVLDGEILAGTPRQIGGFNALQQRLNRKRVTAKMQREFPVLFAPMIYYLPGDRFARPPLIRQAHTAGSRNEADKFPPSGFIRTAGSP